MGSRVGVLRFPSNGTGHDDITVGSTRDLEVDWAPAEGEHSKGVPTGAGYGAVASVVRPGMRIRMEQSRPVAYPRFRVVPWETRPVRGRPENSLREFSRLRCAVDS